GLLAVFAFAARSAMLQIAHIRRSHARDGGPLTASVVTRAAAERAGVSFGAAAAIAAAMLPFVVMGTSAGNELTHAAAVVILGGLATSFVLTQVLLPAMCLAF